MMHLNREFSKIHGAIAMVLGPVVYLLAKMRLGA